MKQKKRMTKAEMVCWLEEVIQRRFEGNKAQAAKVWGIASIELYDVLGGRRSPTKGILKAIGYQKCPTIYYVRVDHGK